MHISNDDEMHELKVNVRRQRYHHLQRRQHVGLDCYHLQ